MSLKSVLKPDSAVMVGLAEAAAVYVIYQSALPPITDVRTAAPDNSDAEAARKAAAWKSAAVLGFVFLITQDLNSFLIGGLALGGIDLMHKHANGVNPSTGKLNGSQIISSQPPGTVPDNSMAFPLADYQTAGTG